MKRLAIILVGLLMVGCGQPQEEEAYSQTGANRPKPTSYMETIEPDGDMSGVIIYNVDPSPQLVAVTSMTFEDIEKTAVVRRSAQQTAEDIATPTEIGPAYIQEDTRVTILIDRYWGDFEDTPPIPIRIGQQIHLKPENQRLKNFSMSYDQTLLKLLYEDSAALTFMFEPLQLGRTTIAIERNSCDTCPYYQSFHSMYIPLEITP